MLQPVHVYCLCGKKLRLNISETNLGKTLEVTCPSCKGKVRTEIPNKIINGSKDFVQKDFDPFSEFDKFKDFFSTKK